MDKNAVRLCEDRFNLIVEALKKRPENYQVGSKILRVAALLRVCGNDERLRRAKVLTLIAEAAFKVSAFMPLFPLRERESFFF